VVAGLGKAHVAALLQAHEIGVAVVPAARALQQVAAHGGGVADRRGGRVPGRLGQGSVRGGQGVEAGELAEGDQRAHAQAAVGLGLDAPQGAALVAADGVQLDQFVGCLQAFLHVIEQVDAAGPQHGAGAGADAGARVVQGGQPYDREAVHRCLATVEVVVVELVPPGAWPGTLPRAVSTLAGVSGRLRTATPRASCTAQAIAAAVGMVAGSPMPIAPVLLAPVWTSVSITSMAGTSRAPRIL